jgi:hypothetical protein
MKPPSIITLAILASLLFMHRPSSAVDLTPYRWQNRLILVFSPTAAVPEYGTFDRQLSAASDEVLDRDLIVIRAFETGGLPTDTPSLSSDDAAALRRRFGVQKNRFTVILIGKDGGVKMVREGQVTLQKIFDLIDSMPMRQQEIRQKGRN